MTSTPKEPEYPALRANARTFRLPHALKHPSASLENIPGVPFFELFPKIITAFFKYLSIFGAFLLARVVEW